LKIDLGQTVGIVANVGVLIGILLLVYELDQNRQMMKAQTRNAIAETLVNLRFSEANNPDIVRVQNLASQGEELTPVERGQFIAHWSAHFRYWENVNYQYRAGLYEDAEYVAQRENWKRILLGQGPIREFWCSQTVVLSEEFFLEMTDLVGGTLCE